MKQAELQVIFVSNENLETIMTWAKTIRSIKRIVVWGSDENVTSRTSDMVITYNDCINLTSDDDPTISSPPKPEDLAIIMYTSGTT